jgi:hypothetical protein
VLFRSVKEYEIAYLGMNSQKPMLSPDANGRYGKHPAGVRRISALAIVFSLGWDFPEATDHDGSAAAAINSSTDRKSVV